MLKLRFYVLFLQLGIACFSQTGNAVENGIFRLIREGNSSKVREKIKKIYSPTGWTKFKQNFGNSQTPLAVLNSKDTSGRTPLVLAIENNLLEVARDLVRRGVNLSGALIAAVKSNDLNRLNWVLSLKVNLEERDSSGNTALLLAVQNNSPELLFALLQAGANSHVASKDGQTSLTWAIRMQNGDLFGPLLYTGVAADSKLGLDNRASLLNENEKEWLSSFVSAHADEFIGFGTYESLSALKKTLIANQVQLDSGIQEILTNRFFKIRLVELEKLAEQNVGIGNFTSGASNSLEAKKNQKACVVCLTPEKPGEFQAGQGPSNCSCFICYACIPAYIENETVNHSGKASLCPGCQQELRLEYFERLGLSPEQLLEIQKRQLQIKLAKIPGWTFCPKPDCFDGEVLTSGSQKVNCPSCLEKVCLVCAQAHSNRCASGDELLNMEYFKLLLEEGRKPAPQGGHSDDPSHPDYYPGRFRPCYYCGVVTERTWDGNKNNHGECNSMTCFSCRKNWHWNFGDHRNHPYILYVDPTTQEMVDWNCLPRTYEPLVPPRF